MRHALRCITIFRFAPAARARLLALVLLPLLLAACAGAPLTPAPQVTSSVSEYSHGYVLGDGDKLRVIVFGESDLSGEFVVDATGRVSLPLVGQTQAAGLSPQEFEAAIAQKLRQGYVRDPKVSVEVIDYRPFYIIGEVSKSGEYAYKTGLNVMGAVAMAGGYTYRANERAIYIRRAGEVKEKRYPAATTVPVLPGDVIRVPERYF